MGEHPTQASPWWRRRAAKIAVGVVAVVAILGVLDQIPPVRWAYQRLTMSEQERAELDSLLGTPWADLERRVVLLWLRKVSHARRQAWQDMDDDTRVRHVRDAVALPERRRRELYCGWLTAQGDAVRDGLRDADLAGIDFQTDPIRYLGYGYERANSVIFHMTLDMERQRITDTGIVAILPIDHVLVDGWCEDCEAARWLAAGERAPCLTTDQLE